MRRQNGNISNKTSTIVALFQQHFIEMSYLRAKMSVAVLLNANRMHKLKCLEQPYRGPDRELRMLRRDCKYYYIHLIFFKDVETAKLNQISRSRLSYEFLDTIVISFLVFRGYMSCYWL